MSPDNRKPHSGADAGVIARYSNLFAQRTGSMTSSAMRDLMSITSRPEVISLAGGLPDTSTFPPESWASLMQGIAADRLASALQYGPTEGHPDARECAVEVMRHEGITVDPDDVLMTTGGQQGLDLVCKILVDPGDVIIAEGPTYPGAITAFNAYEPRVEHVLTDDDGMDPEALREKLAELDAEGARIKFLYLIPNFQNPSGVTLSEDRRREIVKIARERELLIVEDNPYSLLRFEGEAIPSLLEIDGGESVIYLGTFSKILSPGIRLGWVTGPRPVLDKFNLAKQGADLCSSSLSQHFVSGYLNSGHWPEYMTSLRRIYRMRRDAMLESLEAEMPAGTTWTQPAGGLFIWATLPDYIDTTDLLARALRDNVAFVPGRAAWTNGMGSSSMRLNFSGTDEDRIREGISRIAAVASEQVDLYETMLGRPTPKPSAKVADDEGGKVVPLPTRRAAGEAQ